MRGSSTKGHHKIADQGDVTTWVAEVPQLPPPAARTLTKATPLSEVPIIKSNQHIQLLATRLPIKKVSLLPVAARVYAGPRNNNEVMRSQN